MKLINFENILATKALKYAENKVRNAYNKSCQGDWSSVKDIKFLDNIETFYIYQTILECLLHNLVIKKE